MNKKSIPAIAGIGRMSKIGAILVAGVALAVGASGALASSLPEAPTCHCNLNGGARIGWGFKIKPTLINLGSAQILSGPTGSPGSKPLRWQSWTASGATGSGGSWIDNCKPDCGYGNWRAYPIKLKLDRPSHVRGHLIFTRMTITYAGSKPAGVKQSQTWKVKFSSSAQTPWST